jgi:hypothetical protein
MIAERTIALVLPGMDQHIKNFALSIHGTPEIDHGPLGFDAGTFDWSPHRGIGGVTPFCDPAPYAAERFV